MSWDPILALFVLLTFVMGAQALEISVCSTENTKNGKQESKTHLVSLFMHKYERQRFV